MLLRLAVYLLGKSDEDADVKKLMRSARVHILPTMNPDGFERATQGECETEAAE